MTAAAAPVPSKSPRPLLIAPNWWIGILPRDAWKKVKRFFIYEADFINFGAGNVVGTEVDVPVQADSDFLMLGISALITSTANPPAIIWGSAMTNNAVSNLTIRIRDVGSNRDLFGTSPVVNAFPPVDNVCGSGPFPAPLALPYLFGAASTIAVSLFSVSSGVAALNARISLWGVRIYQANE